MPSDIPRDLYAALYGPTVGDRIRLGDTDLWVEVERDATSYGDELLTGFGKTIRDSMQATSRGGQDSKLDLIVTNAVVLDPVLGIFKGNIGIKDGRIVGVGGAGNPDIADNVDLVIGSNTGILAADGMLVTPGGVDVHVHFSTTSILPTALSAGMTTLVGMGYGGIWDLGVNPRTNLRRMMEAFESLPLNVGFLGRGSSVEEAALERNAEAGVAGFKVHEDVAGYPTIVDRALRVAERYDLPVALHTDSLNESGELEDTLAAIQGRTIHAYHVEGAGGGHPNVLELAGIPYILSSSTTPTLPYSVNTAAEHFDMIMVVHRLSERLPEDVEAVRARIRLTTMMAESALHDRGAIPIIASDSQGMGRIGEVPIRAWQTADYMKRRVLAGEAEGDRGERNDNARVLRYLAKYTINPAIAHGLAHEVGSLEPGKLADLVLWRPEFFGVKPQAVVKSGFVVWGPVGDGNGSTRLCEPLRYRPMFGALGRAPAALGVTFVSQAALDGGLQRELGAARRLAPVRGARGLTKADLVRNTASLTVVVDPETLEVRVDGTPVRLSAAESLPLARRYWLI